MQYLIIGDPCGHTTLSLIDNHNVNPTDIYVWEDSTKGQYCAKMEGATVTDNLDDFGDTMFDVTIGNPPYQLGKNSNFYVEFIKQAAKRTRVGGRVSLIIPNRFVLPHTPACKAILSHYQVSKMVVDVNKYFPGVGTKIGMFTGTVSPTGHTGNISVELRDGNTIDWDPTLPSIPSRNPTLDGIKQWSKLMVKNNYHIVNKQPTDTNDYVYVCRQWKTKGGVPYFDAEVGPSDKPRDGKYILTKKPQDLCEFLRSTDIAGELHSLFGDQMNIWPFLWDYIPTCP